MNLCRLFPALVLAIAACASTPTGTPTVTSLANVHTPAAGLLTAGRIQSNDVQNLARSGVRHVIDLTLDSETPDFDEAAAVRAAGMRYDNLPIRGPEDLTLENVRTFDRLVRSSDRPLLVHCASSNRVGAMAALRAAWISGKAIEEAVEEGRLWGLAGLEPAVRARLEAVAPARGSTK